MRVLPRSANVWRVRRRLGGTTMGGRGSAAAAISIAAVLALGAAGATRPPAGTDPSGAETSVDVHRPKPRRRHRQRPSPDRAAARARSRGRRAGIGTAARRQRHPGQRPRRAGSRPSTPSSSTRALGRVDGKSGGAAAQCGRPRRRRPDAQAGRALLLDRRATSRRTTRTQDDVLMGGLTAGYYTARDKFDDIHAVTLWEDNHVTKVELNVRSQGRRREAAGAVPVRDRELLQPAGLIACGRALSPAGRSGPASLSATSDLARHRPPRRRPARPCRRGPAARRTAGRRSRGWPRRCRRPPRRPPG